MQFADMRLRRRAAAHMCLARRTGNIALPPLLVVGRTQEVLIMPSACRDTLSYGTPDMDASANNPSQTSILLYKAVPFTAHMYRSLVCNAESLQAIEYRSCTRKARLTPIGKCRILMSMKAHGAPLSICCSKTETEDSS
jgi:hypothetical protein